MSKAKPVIEVWSWDGQGRIWEWNLVPGVARNPGERKLTNADASRRKAEAFLLKICTRLGVRDTPALRKRIRRAVVVERT